MFDLEMYFEENEISEAEVWEIDEITPIDPVLSGELTDAVPDMDSVVVYGDPFTLGEALDFQQGFDNPYGAYGTCGLTSIANVGSMAGMELTEPEVVEYAMENGLCEEPGDLKSGVLGGGVNISQTLKILSHYQLDSHCEMADVATPDRLAECIEGGHGVILGVNSGVMQGRDWKVYDQNGEIQTTHYITMTGTVRDAESGELKGFYVCDSSSARPDGGAIFVSLDALKKGYTDVNGAHAVITNNAIRS